jgi:hypothetical protein
MEEGQVHEQNPPGSLILPIVDQLKRSLSSRARGDDKRNKKIFKNLFDPGVISIIFSNVDINFSFEF